MKRLILALFILSSLSLAQEVGWAPAKEGYTITSSKLKVIKSKVVKTKVVKAKKVVTPKKKVNK